MYFQILVQTANFLREIDSDEALCLFLGCANLIKEELDDSGVQRPTCVGRALIYSKRFFKSVTRKTK